MLGIVKQESVRIMRESVASIDWSYALDEIVVFPAGCRVPPAIEANSEPYAGVLPPRHRIFDPAAFERASAPRPVPPEPQYLSAADVRARFAWSEAEFATAVTLGFPRPSLRRERLGADGMISEGLWTEAAVDIWAKSIRSLLEGRR